MPDDRSPLPIDTSGNGARLRTIEFDEADAFMLARAMMIASNTALMSGGHVALRRLNHYRDQFLALSPDDAKLLDQDTDLCEIAIAVASHPAWTIHRIREREWSRTFRVVVSVAGDRWKSSNLVGDTEFDAIKALVESIAPPGCIHEEREDTIGSPWI